MSVQCDKEAERQLWAYACRRSFWTYALYGFGIAAFMDVKDEHWCHEYRHRPLADWFERHIREWLETRSTRQRKKKLMVIWPREFGKTTLILKAGSTWIQLQDPDSNLAISSVTKDKSQEFLGAIRETLEGTNQLAWFPRLYGNWRGRPWQKGKLNNNRRTTHGRSEFSYEATAVGTGLTGKHVDAIFIDDPVTLEKLREEGNWLKIVDDHVDSLIPVVKNNGLVVAIATRYDDKDWMGKLMREEGVYELEGMEMQEPWFELKEDGQWAVFFMQARDTLGEPTLPEVWNATALQDYERKSPELFASQMMNAPTSGLHMPISPEQVELMKVDDYEIPWGSLNYSIHIDTAFKDREKVGRGDYNVLQVWGHQPTTGMVYFIDAVRSNMWNATEFLDELVVMLQKMKKLHRKIFIMTDEVGGGKLGSEELLYLNACNAAHVAMPPFMAIHRRAGSRGGPEKRIREAISFWLDGRVRLRRSAPFLGELITEVTRVGHSLHDDMAVAASDVFHPDVYKPEISHRYIGEGYRPMRPWDEVLLTPVRKLTRDEANALYDDALHEGWRE